MQTKLLIKTTVGDLVVAAMEAALELSRNQKKARRLASIVLNKMLAESRLEARARKGIAFKKPLLQ